MLEVTDACFLDLVDGPAKEVTSVANPAQVKLVGWGANAAAGTSPQSVFIELAGATPYFIKASTGVQRPDVATTLKKPGLATSGWEVAANLTDLPAGTYPLKLLMVDGNQGLSCDTHRSLQIGK